MNKTSLLLKKFILFTIVSFIIFALWYRFTFSMGLVSEVEINTPIAKQHLLIATQQSTFKDSISNILIQEYESKDFFIKIVDVHNLKDITLDDFDHIVVIHTIEYYNPPAAVRDIFQDQKSILSNCFFLTTSGGSDFLMEGVDGISSASKLDNLETDTDNIINWINHREK